MSKSPDSFMFTVGKLDAGMAILLGERAHLIEFPSVLLPPGATTGSIVNIAVHRNVAEEVRRDQEFWALQNDILDEFGTTSPEVPKLELRNVTQTSVTLEWQTLNLATAKLRSLDIYRNGQKIAAIPSPLTNTSTKLSGLEMNLEYTLQLILRTTAGTYPSNVIRVRTHSISDTSGIRVCFGNIEDAVMVENAKLALREMKAKWSTNIQIDTTHFVCTNPAAAPLSASAATGSISSQPGVDYQRALQLSIPIVQPHWIMACHADKKMIPIAAYYLGASSSAPMNSPPFTRPQSMSQINLAHSPTSPSANLKAANRASMPPPSKSTASPPNHIKPQQSPESAARAHFKPTPEEPEPDPESEESREQTSRESKRRSRNGTMNMDFRFPADRSPTLSNSNPESNQFGDSASRIPPRVNIPQKQEESVSRISPSNVEVPPPPLMEKEKANVTSPDYGDDDVGETEEIAL